MDDGEDRGKFVDTNIFLYVIQAHPEFGGRSKQILENIDQGEDRALTSMINLAEVCWWLESHQRSSEIRDQIRLITSILNLEIIPLSLHDFLSAAELVQEYPIDFNDCLCLAVMQRMKIDTIYSNDTGFNKTWATREF